MRLQGNLYEHGDSRKIMMEVLQILLEASVLRHAIQVFPIHFGDLKLCLKILDS